MIKTALKIHAKKLWNVLKQPVFHKSIEYSLDNVDFLYTDMSTAVAELQERQKNVHLKETVLQNIGNIPRGLEKNSPCFVIVRHLISPNDEIKRYMSLTSNFNLKRVFFEYLDDKFSTQNFDKKSLIKMPVYLGKRNNGADQIIKIQIGDLNNAQNKKISNIKIYGNDLLVNFHHKLLYKVYPELINSVYDISAWLHQKGNTAEEFYDAYLSQFLFHGILLESFYLNEQERDFTEKVVVPTFKRIYNKYGIKPLICRIAPENGEYDYKWSYYSGDIKALIDNELR